MKYSTSLIAAALLATGVCAAPSPTATLNKRATTMCESWGSVVTGAYTIYHNNWGAAQASSGSQCTTFESLNGNSVAWSTSWTWAGGQGQVKSYSNVALENVGRQLSAVSSIPSVWRWSQTGTNTVNNVAYDLWLSGTQGGENDYEIMVWLAAFGGAGPISSTGSPIATPTIGGTSWTLYQGVNGNFDVFSFVAGSPIENYSGDLYEFLDYLTANNGVSADNYITSLQAGTEPFSGDNVVLTTTDYSISVA